MPVRTAAQHRGQAARLLLRQRVPVWASVLVFDGMQLLNDERIERLA